MARFLPLPLPLKPATLFPLRHYISARSAPSFSPFLSFSQPLSPFFSLSGRLSIRAVSLHFLPFRPYFPRCFALSSVVFIECDVTMRSPTTRVYETHRVRPGRLAARLRVNVLLVISGLATSSPLCSSPPPFLHLLPDRFPPTAPPPAVSLRFSSAPLSLPLTCSQAPNSICIAPSAVRVRKLASVDSAGSELAANSRELREIERRGSAVA